MEELRLLNQIKDKLHRNKAIKTKADKDKPAVIIYVKDYEQRVLEFISNNGAVEVNGNITTKF